MRDHRDSSAGRRNDGTVVCAPWFGTADDASPLSASPLEVLALALGLVALLAVPPVEEEGKCCADSDSALTASRCCSGGAVEGEDEGDGSKEAAD